MSSNNYLQIGLAIITVFIVGILYYSLIYDTSTSLSNTQLKLENINKQVASTTTNVTSLLKNQGDLKTSLNEFTKASEKYYTSNQSSINAITDLLVSLNKYSKSNLLTKQDITDLLNTVKIKLKASNIGTMCGSRYPKYKRKPLKKNMVTVTRYPFNMRGYLTNKGAFTINDTSDQIATIVSNIQQNIAQKTIDYLQSSQKFSNIIQNLLIRYIGSSEVKPVLANTVNDLISSGKINIYTKYINDFNAASIAIANDQIAQHPQIINLVNNINKAQSQLNQLVNTINKNMTALQNVDNAPLTIVKSNEELLPVLQEIPLTQKQIALKNTLENRNIEKEFVNLFNATSEEQKNSALINLRANVKEMTTNAIKVAPELEQQIMAFGDTIVSLINPNDNKYYKDNRYMAINFNVPITSTSDLSGNPIKNTVAGCVNICNANQSCVGFTRSKTALLTDIADCWLKKDIINNPRVLNDDTLMTYVNRKKINPMNNYNLG